MSDDGTFANLFVEALRGERRADLNGDGYVTAEEMGSFLTTSISNYTSNKQVPRYGKLQDPAFDRGDFVFLASLTNTAPIITGTTPRASDFTLGDIASQAAEDSKRRDAWKRTLDEMTAAFNQVRGLDTQDIDIALKIAAWQRFVQAFAQDNPYASEDGEMLREGRARIAVLEKEKQQVEQQLALLDMGRWEDAQAYAQWLSTRTGKRYRLPTEAEWEYAARAGSTTNYSWGNEIGRNLANCDGCGSQWGDNQTAPVGSFATNAFGLHDMHGNVWEWVEDCYQNSYQGAPTDGSAHTGGGCENRILRGGSWGYFPASLRSALRIRDDAPR